MADKEEEPMEINTDTGGENNIQNEDVYLPGKPLAEGEELICDQTAYIMLHQAQTGAPCLSFDVIKDSLGDSRESFPLTAYVIAGTQAAQAHVNSLIVMKLSNLHRTSKEGEEEDEDGDEDDDSDNESELKNPKMTAAAIKHQGCVNRIRVRH